jgi:hypothetical protein
MSGEEAMTSQEAVQATMSPQADGVAARILVVDDEPAIRLFIGRALTAAGYAADFAATGTEALRRARQPLRPHHLGPAHPAPGRLGSPGTDPRRTPGSGGARVVLPGRRRGQGGLPGVRGAGLAGQAVLAGRAAGPGPGQAARQDRGGRARPGWGDRPGRQPHAGRRPAGRRHRGRGGAADQARVPAAARAGRTSGPVGRQGSAAGQRVGSRLRTGLNQGRS